MMMATRIGAEEENGGTCVYGVFCYNKPNQPPQKCIDLCRSRFGPSIAVSCKVCGASPIPLCFCG